MLRTLPLVALMACQTTTTPDVAADTDAAGRETSFRLKNVGDSSMEGHTPRGFQGSGTGLFAGDNINGGFPEGDGVQIFISFPLPEAADGIALAGTTVASAELFSKSHSVNGTPFADLGAFVAEEIQYDSFSTALWNADTVAGGASCVFATSDDDDFSCDLGAAVQTAIDGGQSHVQFRLRFETAGDSDGSSDLLMFNPDDSNTNESGLFKLDVVVF